MNEIEFYLVKEYNFVNPPIQKIDSLIDNSIKDCYKKYFHRFKYKLVYDINFTNITNNEKVNSTISDKIMGIYELNKKLTLDRERGFKFNHINNFKIKIYSNLSNINIHYHLKLGSPPLHRQFFIKIAHNLNYIQTHCNNLKNPFHFACRQWYSYNKI